MAGFSHAPAIELAEKLIESSSPSLTRCFYVDNGSSAIESALKMSYHSWLNQGKTNKTKFITLSNSYHGETLDALAMGEAYDGRERRVLRVYEYALTQEVVLKLLGNVIYFMPPYMITEAQIDILAEVAMLGIERVTLN